MDMAQRLVISSPSCPTQRMADLGWRQPFSLFFPILRKGYPSSSSSSSSSFTCRTGGMLVSALQDPEQRRRRGRRAVDVIRLLPQVARNYFRSPFRRALFGGISLLGGFYVAQTISLSFGALGVNDVIAAALCVLITEYITRFYHTRVRTTFPLALLNNFKMGFTYGLFIDAFKLAS